MKKKIPVNKIITERGITVGYVLDDNQVVTNLLLFLSVMEAQTIVLKLVNNPNGIHFADRLSQFVVYVEFHPERKWLMTVSDFGDNFDTALDHYLILKKIGWGDEIKNEILSITRDIQDNPKDTAEMVLIENNPISEWMFLLN